MITLSVLKFLSHENPQTFYWLSFYSFCCYIYLYSVSPPSLSDCLCLSVSDSCGSWLSPFIMWVLGLNSGH